ncbi:hypothetical protein [Winogradskyella sp.]|uniref:hypothetical protein n=1 Tax=Winogradskyella sp. TaxID=1883156 RepID=UPI003AB87C38
MSNTNKSNELSREELYNLVWSKPVSTILKEYPIKITAFKRLCKENEIPLPKNGYWVKLKHHKKVEIIPLPITDKGNVTISLLGKGVELSENNLLIEEIKGDKSLTSSVSKKLYKPDEIVIRTRDYYSKRRKTRYPRNTQIPKEGIFSLNVSQAVEKRVFRFIDALIKLVRKRGHDLKIITDHKYYNYNGTKLIVFDEYFDIRLREVNKRVIEENERGWKESKYFPTGKLCLKIDEYPRYEWTDTKTKTLEDKLPNILAYFELRAKREKEERIEREIRHKEYERKKRIEEELNAKRKKELEAFRSVLNHSSRWQKAMDLRNYIQTIESNAIKNGTLTQELKNWLQWIKDKADWYDPLIEKDDELFRDVDRDFI